MREPQRRFQAFFVGKANYFFTRTIFFVDSLASYVHFHKENGFPFTRKPWVGTGFLGVSNSSTYKRLRFGRFGKKPASIFFPKLTPDNADLHRVSEAAALARKPYKRTYGDGWTLWTQQQPWSISRQVLSLIMNPRRRVDNV